MISLMFRIALICGSLVTAGYMVKKIRQSKLQIEYSSQSGYFKHFPGDYHIRRFSSWNLFFYQLYFSADFCPFDSQSIPYDDRAFHIRISGERTGTETGNLRKNRAG